MAAAAAATPGLGPLQLQVRPTGVGRQPHLPSSEVQIIPAFGVSDMSSAGDPSHPDTFVYSGQA